MYGEMPVLPFFSSFSVVEYDIIYVKYYKMMQSRVCFCYYDMMNIYMFIWKVSAKLRYVQKSVHKLRI